MRRFGLGLCSLAFGATGILLAGCGGSTAPATPDSAEAAPAQVSNDAGAATDGAGGEAPVPTPSSAKLEADNSKKSDKALLGSPDLTAGIPGEGPLTVAEINAWLDRPEVHYVLDVELPMGLKAGQVPAGVLEKNPMTRAKIELGRQLYFDPRLSADGMISCASCHHPDEGYAKHTQFGIGIASLQGNRNSPTAYNRILSTAQFWDGRADSLEEQAKGPIENPVEMGNSHATCVETVRNIEGYRVQFERIFNDREITIDHVAQAIATFERTLVTGPSPFDYYERLIPYQRFTEEDFEDDPDLKAKYDELLAESKAHPMSESAIRGRNLFFSERVNCAACHVGANLTDEKFHNLGVGMDQPNPDLGRYEVTKDEKDKGAYKTPTIRNIAQTPPYMHDGSQKTLLEVVEHYNKGGIANPQLSDKIKKLDLTEQEKLDLVAFMEACTGELPKVEPERLPQ